MTTSLLIIFFAIVFVGITITIEIRQKLQNNEAEVKTWNYKLSAISRIIYIVAMCTLLILPCKALDMQNNVISAIFEAIPSIFLFFASIIAINQRNVNAALHFIALGGSTLGLLMCMMNMDSPLCSEQWIDRVIFAMITSAITCCYAFFAWIVALSHRNDQ